jgi:hypothetical protein
VEGQHEIGPSLPAQHTVGAALVTFDRPAYPQQRAARTRRAFVEGQRVTPRRR